VSKAATLSIATMAQSLDSNDLSPEIQKYPMFFLCSATITTLEKRLFPRTLFQRMHQEG
jgi:hypothetical protein